MTASPEAITVAVVLFVSLAAYALLAGADFGGGIWDLLAGGAPRRARRSTRRSRRCGRPTTSG